MGWESRDAVDGVGAGFWGCEEWRWRLGLVLGEQYGAVVVGFEGYCEWLCGVGIGFGGAVWRGCGWF